MVYEEDFEPRIRPAILGTVMYKWLDMLYYRQIVGDTGGSDLKFLGYLIVEPPAQDPDTFFESLVQDPLLGGILTGLRSQVDPAIVIPSPTPGCLRDKYY